MQELTSKHVIPYMEQKIRALNQQVAVSNICSRTFFLSVDIGRDLFF